MVEPVIGVGARIIRATLFDKTASANWKVPWHQDLMFPVAKRIDGVLAVAQWSKKDGVWHMQPPVSVLEQMLAVRIHLDNCGDGNGPLRVIPGSHRNGKLADDEIRQAVAQHGGSGVSCTVGAGGAVLMRPLLLHASSAAAKPEHRRVVHLDFVASDALPGPLLDWAY